MKSFDEHFKGAKNYNQEDLKWLFFYDFHPTL